MNITTYLYIFDVDDTLSAVIRGGNYNRDHNTINPELNGTTSGIITRNLTKNKNPVYILTGRAECFKIKISEITGVPVAKVYTNKSGTNKIEHKKKSVLEIINIVRLQNPDSKIVCYHFDDDSDALDACRLNEYSDINTMYVPFLVNLNTDPVFEPYNGSVNGFAVVLPTPPGGGKSHLLSLLNANYPDAVHFFVDDENHKLKAELEENQEAFKQRHLRTYNDKLAANKKKGIDQTDKQLLKSIIGYLVSVNLAKFLAKNQDKVVLIDIISDISSTAKPMNVLHLRPKYKDHPLYLMWCLMNVMNRHTGINKDGSTLHILNEVFPKKLKDLKKTEKNCKHFISIGVYPNLKVDDENLKFCSELKQLLLNFYNPPQGKTLISCMQQQFGKNVLLNITELGKQFHEAFIAANPADTIVSDAINQIKTWSSNRPAPNRTVPSGMYFGAVLKEDINPDLTDTKFIKINNQHITYFYEGKPLSGFNKLCQITEFTVTGMLESDKVLTLLVKPTCNTVFTDHYSDLNRTAHITLMVKPGVSPLESLRLINDPTCNIVSPPAEYQNLVISVVPEFRFGEQPTKPNSTKSFTVTNTSSDCPKDHILIQKLASVLITTAEDVFFGIGMLDMFARLLKTLSISDIIKMFNSNGYMLSNKSYKNHNVIKLVYIDGYPNVVWAKFARYMRGSYIAVNKHTNKITPLKITFKRGAEIGSRQLISTGVTETQDGDISKMGQDTRFDPIQRSLATLLAGSSDLNARHKFIGELHMKADGSFLGIIKVPKNTEPYQIFTSMFTDPEFDSIGPILVEFAHINGCLYVPVSNNTEVIRLDGNNFFFGALIDGLYSGTTLDQSDLARYKFASENTDHKLAFKKLFPLFIQELNKIVISDANTNTIISYCFELICKNQTNIYGQKVPFLAVSYPTASLPLLGARVYPAGEFDELNPNLNLNSEGIYIPHSQFKSSGSFTTPMFWKLSNVDSINTLLEAVEQVLTGQITEQDFLDCNPPSGPTGEFHFEGFVLLTWQLDDLKFKDPDYEKVKLPIWYPLHKYDKRGNKTYVAMSKVVPKYRHMFPLIGTLEEFISAADSSSLNPMQIKLRDGCNQIWDVIRIKIIESADNLNILPDSWNDNRKQAFLIKPLSDKILVLLNHTEEWYTLAVTNMPFINSNYHKIKIVNSISDIYDQNRYKDSKKLLIEIINFLKPWEDNYLTRVKQIAVINGEDTTSLSQRLFTLKLGE